MTMQLRDFIIAGILFSVVVGLVGIALVDFSDSYDIQVDTDFNTTFNKLNAFSGNIDNISSTLNPDDPNESGGGGEGSVFDFMMTSVWGVLKIFLSLPTLFASLFIDVAAMLSLPPIVAYGAIAILTVIVVMMVVSALVRRDL